MKALNEPKRVTAANAWGRDSTTIHQDWEVEKQDVGRTFQHYLGFNHKSHVMNPQDVGRVMTVQTASGWQCWSWK